MTKPERVSTRAATARNLARSVRQGRRLLPCLLYAILACTATRPLLFHASSQLPLGVERVATVPLASAWALWWTSDRVRHGLTDYWDAPIFAPASHTFALSEPMPLAGLAAAPLLALGLPLALVYNILVWGALTLNGLSAYWLLRRFRLAGCAALSGGAFVCLMPSLHQQLGVLTLVPLFAVVWTLHATLTLRRAQTVLRGAALGGAFAVAFLLCAQYALLLAIALVPAACALFGRELLAPKLLVALLCGCCLAGAAMAPVIVGQRRAAELHTLQRSATRVYLGAAHPESFVQSPVALWPKPSFVSVSKRGSLAFFPGMAKLALALVGGLAGLRGRARRSLTTFLLLVLLFLVALSLSPRISLAPLGAHAGDPSLHALLAAIVPGLSAVRSIWRAALLAEIALSLLSALGIHAIFVWMRRHVRNRNIAVGAAALAGMLASAETWPNTQQLSPVPEASAYGAWAAFMRDHLEPGEPYCLLPFAMDRELAALEDTARFMYLSGLHDRRMVNGYSSYFPATYERLRRARLRVGDAETARLLKSYGVRYVVFRGDREAGRELGSWKLRFVAPALRLAVYELP